MLWETAKIVIKEQLKQENQRKLFEKLLFMIIRPEFKTVGCFDRFVQVFIAVSVVSVVSFRCFGGFGGSGGSGGFVSVFRWFRRFRWFRSGGFVSVFRVLVHAVYDNDLNVQVLESGNTWSTMTSAIESCLQINKENFLSFMSQSFPRKGKSHSTA